MAAKHILAAGLMVVASASSASAAISLDTVQADRPTDKMTINVVTVNGSGCPIGTAAVAVSPDNTAFTVTYSEYIAQTGQGIALTEGRKNCQMNLKVNVPSGFTFAINKTDYRGYLELARGATAVTRANYYFQGMSSNASATRTINGPVSGDWQTTDVVALTSMVWHPCGAQRNLNVNTELRVNKGSSTQPSYIAMDSADGSINTIYHFSWARC